MSGNDDGEYSIPDSGLEMDDSIDSETHDDVDPFEELGIGSRSITSTDEKNVSRGYDAFSELMNDDSEDEVGSEVTETEDEVEEEIFGFGVSTN